MLVLQGLWAGVWAEGAPSTAAALRLYMDDIVPLIHQGALTLCYTGLGCRLLWGGFVLPAVQVHGSMGCAPAVLWPGWLLLHCRAQWD